MRMSWPIALGWSIIAVALSAHAWTDPKALPDATTAPPSEALPNSPPAAPPTENDPYRYRTLSDIRHIAVELRGTNNREWSRYGFRDAEVRETITKRLVAAGFKVVGPGSSLLDKDTVVLEVVAHVNDQAVGHSYLVFLRLKDKLALPNNPQGYVTRTVWSDWKIGGFEPYNYRKLRATILELVDNFVSQYQLYP